MNFCSRISKAIVITALSGAAGASAAMEWNLFSVKPKEIAGTVRDITTGEPVVGAYVLAIYREAGGQLFAHSASWCVKTKGMYTAADGKYQFPIEQGQQLQIRAIKPDFYTQTWGPEVQRWEKEKKEPYSSDSISKDIFLARQDPANPFSYFNAFVCERPKAREDVVANIEYLKLLLGETTKYDPKRARMWEDSIPDSIRILERMPWSHSGSQDNAADSKSLELK